jgi:hypothetical protein
MRYGAEAAKAHIEHHSEGFQAINVSSTAVVAREAFVKALARIAVIQGANIVTRAEVRPPECLRDTV